MEFSVTNSVILPRLIAHAGGGYEGHTYTNSLEALNNSKDNGFTWIEVDFTWTNDGYLVLLHDWEVTFILNFYGPAGQKSLREYKGLVSKHGLTHLDLSELIVWLKQNPSIFIVTDIKQENVRGLGEIARKYSNMINRFIPQIFDFGELEQVKNLGYRNIIFALYRSNYSDKEIVEFCEANKLLAVSMPISRDYSFFANVLLKYNIKVYVHTINELEQMRKILSAGAYGIYTDFISSYRGVSNTPLQYPPD